MFSERSWAFMGAGITVLAWVIFWEGLLRAWANTHPTNPTAHGLVKLIGD